MGAPPLQGTRCRLPGLLRPRLTQSRARASAENDPLTRPTVHHRHSIRRSVRVSAASAMQLMAALCGVLAAPPGIGGALEDPPSTGPADFVITDAQIYRGAKLPAAQAMA